MRTLWSGLLIGALLWAGCMALPATTQAQTCEARNDGNVPNYTNGTPNPIICDTHGSQRVTIMGPSGSTSGVSLVTPNGDSVMDETNDAVSVTLDTLISGEDQTNNLLMTSGGAVRSTTMASAVTTNTTSSAVALPVGSKSIYGSVTGTGAITQTQAIYGGITSGVTSTTGILLCTLTLSGTTAVYDACPVMTANFLYYIVVTTATTGTSASGTVTAMY